MIDEVCQPGRVDESLPQLSHALARNTQPIVSMAAARRWFLIGISGCALVFLLLLNEHWVRSGDGDVYLGIARNLVRGKGYAFNGQPVAIVPPLWPWILAGAMQVNSSFIFLKLVPIACMMGFLAISYWILLRFTTPRRSAAIIVLTALLAQVYPLTIGFFSDGPFAMLASGALLLAMQINEGRPARWRGIGMIVLLVASLMVRWNGLLWWAMIAAALLRGQRQFSVTRGVFLAWMSGCATLATFIFLRVFLKVHPEALDPRYDTFLAGAYKIVNTPQNFEDLMWRLINFGGWISGLLWDVLYDSRQLRIAMVICGWFVLAACAITLWNSVRKANWLGIAAALQLLLLGINWPHPMPRYMLPVTPLIIAAAWIGIDYAGNWARQYNALIYLRKALVGIFVVSVILANFAEYFLELWVQRSSDFYRHHEAGTNRSLVAAAKFLSEQADPAVEISITSRTQRNGRAISTAGPMRAFNFLCGRPIMVAPGYLSDEPEKGLNRWAERHNVRYYLWQPPIETWYHIRGSLENPKGYDDGDYDWRLYRVVDGRFKQITIPPLEESWPTTVPGLE